MSAPVNPRAFYSAYMLWLFLGLFGAHRFYVGRTGSGIVWLCTFGLFGIGWIIDAFLIPEVGIDLVNIL